MKQEIGTTTRRLEIDLGSVAPLARRLAPAAGIFAIAFMIDMATGQRSSSVWGSIAIVASIVAVFPAVRPALAALGAYGGVWVVFNVVRAVADDAGLALAGPDAAARWERALFGDTLPSAALQDRLFDPASGGPHDVALALVHGSFFAVPFVVAALLWWRRRELFHPYAVATAATFALGLVGFLLLPTAPPWFAAPDDVTRVTHHLLATEWGIALGSTEGDAGFRFEPNDLAALPSVHVAATVLVALVARRAGRLAGLLGGFYALAMTVAVVYLGEHYVLDAALGWLIALAGWWVARSLPAGKQ